MHLNVSTPAATRRLPASLRWLACLGLALAGITPALAQTAPTVTIDQAAGQADPTSTSPIVFDVVFSENVTGFTASDVSFSASTAGGTLTDVVTPGADAAHYTVSVTGMTTSGTVIATIPAGAAQSSATSLASTQSTSTDNTVTWVAPPPPTPPTVTINQDGAQADPTSTSPIVFDVVFSENVTGFTGSDVSLSASTAGGTLVAVANPGADAAHYTVSVTGMTTSGAVIATIPAGAAQSSATSLASTQSTSTDNTVTWVAPPPPTAPTVTINQAAGQADPTASSPIVFAVAFSETVSGFTAGDVNLAASTAGGTLTAVVTPGANAALYVVSVSGMTTAGTVVASIPAGAAQSIATSLPSAASTSTDNTVAFAPGAAAPTVLPAPATTAWGSLLLGVLLACAAVSLRRRRARSA